MDVYALVALLADGELHSGVEMGERLGVSRTTIWKMLDQVKELGIAVDVIKGRGYRIQNGLNLLSEEAIRVALQSNSEVSKEVELSIEQNAVSTNASALRCLSGGALSECVVVAESQTGGRGRRGREWVSPYGKNIYLSYGFKFVGDVADLEGLSVALGVALAEQFSSYNIEGVQLKWPNDIYLNERKLGGILIELNGEFQGNCDVILGVGLNVNMMPGVETGMVIDQPWTSLLNEGVVLDRNLLIAGVITAVTVVLAKLKGGCLQDLFALWDRYDYLRGEEVVVAGVEAGVADGITENGSLIVVNGEKRSAINFGEVGIRKKKLI
ncbi:MAG: biotin--[acetyl-CoA-carboxylase] ligase [Pseudomonadales bacterium]|nr:biotin--[acetyl-CoA-carboxylase] ligase [Pseudomonadales bacterium]